MASGCRRHRESSRRSNRIRGVVDQSRRAARDGAPRVSRHHVDDTPTSRRLRGEPGWAQGDLRVPSIRSSSARKYRAIHERGRGRMQRAPRRASRVPAALDPCVRCREGGGLETGDSARVLRAPTPSASRVVRGIPGLRLAIVDHVAAGDPLEICPIDSLAKLF